MISNNYKINNYFNNNKKGNKKMKINKFFKLNIKMINFKIKTIKIINQIKIQKKSKLIKTNKIIVKILNKANTSVIYINKNSYNNFITCKNNKKSRIKINNHFYPQLIKDILQFQTLITL